LDATHLEIAELEGEMSSIQDSASLFEVNVPDFKQIKQCRKELRMLKVKQLIISVT
jgi:dynein heavy chain